MANLLDKREGMMIRDDRLQVERVNGVIPICAACKRVRDNHGNWYQVETVRLDQVKFELSHGICPDCAKELYPEFF